MSVKPIKRKEQAPMDLDPVMKKPDMEIESPRLQEQDPGIPDHTHSEYDEMMVMMQEMQAKISQLEQQGGMELAERREALTGVPNKEDEERSKKTTNQIGPDGTSEVPQTTQPANGEAPGDEDSDHDKFADKPADDAAGKAPKPSSDYTRPSVTKNKFRKGREQVLPVAINDAEGAADQSSDQAEDPTKVAPVSPAPANPEPMEGVQKQQLEGEDKEEEKDKPLEGSSTEMAPGEIVDDMEYDDKKEPLMTTELIVRREFEKLKRESRREAKARKKESSLAFDTEMEQLMGKKTIVGGMKRTQESAGNSENDIMTARQKSNNVMLEYLGKTGNKNAQKIARGF